MIKLLRDDSTLKEYLPIMGQKGYISAKSDDYGWFKSEEFAIAFVIDKQAIFKRLIFMSEVVSLKGVEFSEDEEREFLEEVIRFIKKENIADFINKAHSNVVFKSCPKGAICVPWGTHVVELDNTDEELLKKIKPKIRQKIRKAIREGVSIKVTKELKLIYEIIKDTMQRQGSIHYPSLKYLNTLKKNLPNNARFYMSYFNNRVQGCAIVVFDKKRAYVPYAGSVFKVEHTGALHLMHFKVMQDMHSLGVREYDFVGTRLYNIEDSKFASIARFKKGFNPRVDKGYAFKYIINQFKYKLFNLSSKTYLLLFKRCQYIEPIDSIKREYDMVLQGGYGD